MSGRNYTVRRARLPKPLLCLPLLAALTVTTQARTLFVNQNATGNSHNGLSWATAYLRVADAASGAQAQDEIWVAKGTYTDPVSLTSPVALYGGFSGGESQRTDRRIQQNPTVLDGQSMHTVVDITGDGAVLDGFTVQNGMADDYPGRNGGGIRCAANNVVISNNIIAHNSAHGSTFFSGTSVQATGEGGAVVLIGNGNILRGNTITDNTLNVSGANSQGYNNSATAMGGGVVCFGAGITVQGNVIARDVAGADGSSSHGEATGTSYGGGIYCGKDTTGVIEDNLFDANTADANDGGYGGGLYNDSAVNVYNNTFVNNAAPQNTVQGQGTFGGGGAAYVLGGTFANNIAAFNSSGVEGTSVALSHNDVYGNTQFNYAANGSSTPPSTDINVDPLFVNQNGGDYHLQATSPAVNAGDDSAAGPSDTDLDGRPRLIGAHVDIGAYETGRVLYVNGSSTGTTHDGLSWATAFLKVQDGVAAAQTGEDVWVARGTYLENVTIANGVGLYGGFTGGEAARTQRNPSANVTIVDAQNMGSVVTVSGAGAAIDGFTVRNGSAYFGGGGINCSAANATISGNVVTGNTAFGPGGGINCSAAVIRNNTILGNSSPYGGGICATGAGTLIAGNTISNNFAFNNGSGGGILCGGPSVTIQDNVISGNISTALDGQNGGAAPAYGGGVSCVADQFLISRNTLFHNSAEGTGQSSGPHGTTLNTGYGYGGGIYASANAGGSGIITDNLIAANDAGGSAGGYGNGVCAQGHVTLSNNTVVGGTTKGDMGGSAIELGDANTAGGAFTLVNNIIAFNKAGVEQARAADTVALNNNDLFANTGYDYQNVSDPGASSGSLHADPLFVNRSGGDYHLQAASPCLDAGLDSAVQTGDTDLDGKPRKLGSHADIGAYESLAVNASALADATRALRLAAGLAVATPDDKSHLNVETGGTSAGIIGVEDASRLVRKAVGLDS